MRVIVLIKATSDSEAGFMPATELLEAMGNYNEELVNAGVMLAGEGLQPSSEGKRVAFDGDSRTVIDGPFAASGELVCGLWIWQVRDMAEAVAWVKRCPNPMPGRSEIEIRPLFEIEEFGEEMTPALREQEERLRQETPGGSFARPFRWAPASTRKSSPTHRNRLSPTPPGPQLQCRRQQNKVDTPPPPLRLSNFVQLCYTP